MSVEVVKTEDRQAAAFHVCFPVQKATVVIVHMNKAHTWFRV